MSGFEQSPQITALRRLPIICSTQFSHTLSTLRDFRSVYVRLGLAVFVFSRAFLCFSRAFWSMFVFLVRFLWRLRKSALKNRILEFHLASASDFFLTKMK